MCDADWVQRNGVIALLKNVCIHLFIENSYRVIINNAEKNNQLGCHG